MTSRKSISGMLSPGNSRASSGRNRVGSSALYQLCSTNSAATDNHYSGLKMGTSDIEAQLLEVNNSFTYFMSIILMVNWYRYLFDGYTQCHVSMYFLYHCRQLHRTM